MAGCYVKFYHDWIEQTAALEYDEIGRLFIAILEYDRSGVEPHLDGRESILFPVFRSVIDREREKAKINSENGAKGGRGRKATESETKPTINIKHKTKDKDKDISPPYPPRGAAKREKEEQFDEFWSKYPKKVAKSSAKKAFEKVSAPLETLLTAIERQKCSEQWSKDNGQFIPNPATWLNQERWNDELPEAKNTGNYAPGERNLDADEQEAIRRMMLE